MRPSSDLDRVLGHEFPALNKGFVRVIDYMGNDAAIVQAARVSYGTGTKTVREDEGLIRYLMRNNHTTPFEMCEIKLHCKMPIFVARQWVRHRTANINEYSARYSILDNDYYLPEAFYSQDTKNRQGSTQEIASESDHMIDEVEKHSSQAYALYEKLMKCGSSRELARMVLSVNFYTQWYWKIDLHNLLHFLDLRCDSHAQSEIRAYANTIANIVGIWVPITHKAWRESRDK